MTSIFLFLLGILFNAALASLDYYGARSTEAELSFKGEIELNVKKAYDLASLKGSYKTKAHQSVDKQLQFLIGYFQSQSFLKTFGHGGVLSDDYSFKFIQAHAPVHGKQKLVYEFQGKVLFDSLSFKHQPAVSIPIKLPIELSQFYNLGLVKGKNRCTDPEYDSEEDLFYFWDTELPNCPLKGKNPAVYTVTGKMQAKANTVLSYPEYHQLYNHQDLKISVFMGYIDYTAPNNHRRDVAYTSFKEVLNWLETLGLEKTLDEHPDYLSYGVTFERELQTKLGTRLKLMVEIFLSDTSAYSEHPLFEQRYKKALKTSHIIAFDGHSGLGADLAIERFLSRQLPAFYQLMFFNSCSSYPYYNQSYFNRKPGGSLNLDIITAGLPTYTSSSVSNLQAFLSPFLTGKIISYQKLLQQLEKSNLGGGTYLMGVSGDEDNEFKEKAARSPLSEN